MMKMMPLGPLVLANGPSRLELFEEAPSSI
jgi:hypothetical protein